MSWQAQTAVNHHSKINDMKLFRLLLYLAEGADDNGRIDPAPSQDTLADFYAVSTRTIRNWLNALCDSGEIEQTRIGSGPGNPSAYRITLQLPDKGGNKAEENITNLSAFSDFMVEIKAEIDTLKAEILAIKVEKVEAKGGKGGSKRRKAHSSKSADDPLDQTLDPEEEELAATPQPQPKDTPFGLYQELKAIDRGIRQGQALKEGKILLEKYSPDDIIACARFLQTDPWRIANMVTLSTQAIQEKIDKWIGAGRPANWSAWQVKAPSYQNGRNGHNPTRPQPAPASERTGGFF